ncbi:hypothetical protein [Allorhizobium undicola]|uniref:hypothetical protein n=1 Tax=Allorhizobium undicola TaxID=78527 RepID=UPI0004843C2C|nr:hypothetical protein [Allorhizobium undicola]
MRNIKSFFELFFKTLQARLEMTLKKVGLSCGAACCSKPIFARLKTIFLAPLNPAAEEVACKPEKKYRPLDDGPAVLRRQLPRKGIFNAKPTMKIADISKPSMACPVICNRIGMVIRRRI